MSLGCHIFVSEMNQRNADFGSKKVDSRLSCVAPGMERFSLDLLQAATKNVPWKRVDGVGALQNSWSKADLR